MLRKILSITVLGVCLTLLISGCKVNKFGQQTRQRDLEEREAVVPPHIAGTVSEYARLIGSAPMPLQGHGVIMGLGRNGSAEVPPHLKQYLEKYLNLRGFGSPRAGTAQVTATRVLRDMDTAVVVVGGAIPPGAPKGTRFDVFVSAHPHTQTQSLDGGILMPTELHRAVKGRAMVAGPTKVLAAATGAVFVNPFVDPQKHSEIDKLNSGRIISGGKVIVPQPVHLQLRRSDVARARLIERKINERFAMNDKAANAKNPSIIELTIPRHWRKDYRHFLELVMHLPLSSGPGVWEAKAREIATAMELPAAKHDDLALVWDAMGRQVRPVIERLYTSKNPAAAFYAARTGLRLGDRKALEVILSLATKSGSHLQIPAIKELGRHSNMVRCVPTLRQLVDDENELVRLATYKALLEHGDRLTIDTIDVGGQFGLDLVNSRRDYVIYTTQCVKPRIVLFGKKMTVSRPVFFSAPEDLVTINALEDSKKLMVLRKILKPGELGEVFSDPFEIDFYVSTLIRTLGEKPAPGPDGRIMGLGLTYSQVVGVLYGMCKGGDIRAKFVLQPLPEVQRIYESAVSPGAADVFGP